MLLLDPFDEMLAWFGALLSDIAQYAAERSVIDGDAT